MSSEQTPRQSGHASQWRRRWLAAGVAVWGGVATLVPGADFVLGDHVARPGTIVRVPVVVPDATGLAAVALQLNFDPQVLALESVTNGPLGAGMLVDYHVDDGRLKVAAVRDRSLVAGSGSLLALTFRMNSGATPGRVSPLVFADTGASGQYGRELAWTRPVTHTDGQVRAVSETEDSDEDGLPDWWEEEHFGGPVGAKPLADADGDGMSNAQEFVAGTNPMAAGSVLRLWSVGPVPGGWELAFSSAAGRNYHLEASDDLRGWERVGTRLSGNGGVVTVVDASAPGVERFYRVVVVP